MKKNNKSAQKSQIESSDQKKSLDPQDGKYFFYPNEYKDALCRIRIAGEARQILDVIERFTLGFNTKEAAISFKTFRKRTGMDDRHIVRGRKKLIEKGMISTAQKGSRNDVYYRIEMDYTKWKPLPKMAVRETTAQNGSEATAQNGSEPLPKMAVPSFKYTYLNTEYKDREFDKKIEDLKTRRKELQEDLEEFKKQNPGGKNENLIEGIKRVNYQIADLKVARTQALKNSARIKKEEKAKKREDQKIQKKQRQQKKRSQEK